MRALVLSGTKVGFEKDRAEPVIGENEALVKVRMAGLCQTDLELAKGYMGFGGVLGHEFVGEVVRSGNSADGHWIGKRVCGEINCACGGCAMCGRGLPTHCLRRSVIGILNHDGAFADFVWVPVRNLHAVPDSVSDAEAVFVEPLAAAFQILEQVAIGPGVRVVVLGDGRLGQLIVQVLAKTGCDLVLVGRHEEKLAMARRRGVIGQVDDRAMGRDADVVVDCTGRAEGFARALELVRPRGTVVMKTTVAGNPPTNLAPIVIDEITVVGSRCGPFAKAIAALEKREVEVISLVSARVKLEEAAGLFEGVAGSLKTLIEL